MERPKQQTGGPEREVGELPPSREAAVQLTMHPVIIGTNHRGLTAFSETRPDLVQPAGALMPQSAAVPRAAAVDVSQSGNASASRSSHPGSMQSYVDSHFWSY
jgi:hypothetical protein